MEWWNESEFNEERRGGGGKLKLGCYPRTFVLLKKKKKKEKKKVDVNGRLPRVFVYNVFLRNPTPFVSGSQKKETNTSGWIWVEICVMWTFSDIIVNGAIIKNIRKKKESWVWNIVRCSFD